MVPPIVRKLITAMLLLVSTAAFVPTTVAESFCSIEPCCASDMMDCCTMQSAPAPAPELVLREQVRISQPSSAIFTTAPSFETVPVDVTEQAEVLVFGESPPDRLALLSTYLI